MKRKEAFTVGFKKGQLVFADALYFRSPEDVCALEGVTADKIIRAVIVYLAYGYLELAEIFCQMASETRILPFEVSRDVHFMLKSFRSPLRIPDFRGKGRISTALSRLAELFSRNTWYSADSKIGNR